MSPQSQDFRCIALPSSHFSQAEVLMSSFESTTAYFPAQRSPQSPNWLPDMSLDGRTLLELDDAWADVGSSYRVSDESPTVALREIYSKPEASGQLIVSREEKPQHQTSDSTEFTCSFTDNRSAFSTADPHRAHGLRDRHLQAPLESRTILRPGFECRYEHCHGKDGGKKIYARVEHRNRHERTVHRRTADALYRCWVRNCRSKTFTRADNLKAHLRVRHGRKSKAGRYQYVATLDRSSSYYDPEWTGDVTSDGLPK